jgi:hypothetical protein
MGAHPNASIQNSRVWMDARCPRFAPVFLGANLGLTPGADRRLPEFSRLSISGPPCVCRFSYIVRIARPLAPSSSASCKIDPRTG